MSRLLAALLIAATLGPASTAARAPCVSQKATAAGTDAAARLRCQAKAARTGAEVAPHCLARADAKLLARFVRAERGSDCPSSDDGPAVAALVDSFVSAVARSIPPGTHHGGRRCAAAKLASVAKTAARRLDCHAQALRIGIPVAVACLDATAAHFARDIRTAEGKSGCAITGDEAALEASIEGFTTVLVATLTSPGSTTTTTTTVTTLTTIAGSTSSSTTTPGTPSTTTTSTLLGRTVSFRTEVQPILTTRCALPLCHTGPFPQAGLSFMRAQRSYTDLVGSPSTECPAVDRVLAGSPGGSYLITKLQGAGPCFTGVPMPNGGPPLSPGELALFIQWIAEGAPDN